MPVPTRVPLGTSTLNRKWLVDVNTGTIGSPVWVGVFGVTDNKPSWDQTTQDDSDFDSAGQKSQTITAVGWGLQMKLARKTQVLAPTQYDPGQEFLRTKAVQLGSNNIVNCRFYEYDIAGGPQVEAYQGNVTVSWEEDGGGMDALSSITCNLTGVGARTAITHPAAAATPAPTIASVTPTTGGVAGGFEVVAVGTNFTGATALVVGVTTVSAANWQVVDSTRIAFVSPAKTAGTYDVQVTTPGGTSGTSATTKITYS
jgi:hypothetical protein